MKLSKLSLEDFIEIKTKLESLTSEVESKAKQIGNNALSLINAIDVDEKSYAYSGAIIKFFKKLISDNLLDEDFEAMKQVTSIVTKNNHASSKATDYEKQSISGISPLLNNHFYEALALIDNEFQQYILYSIIKKNIFLLALLNEINSCLQSIKSEQSKIHISEFNKLIAKIVVDEPAPFIYERLGEKYKHFFN